MSVKVASNIWGVVGDCKGIWMDLDGLMDWMVLLYMLDMIL